MIVERAFNYLGRPTSFFFTCTLLIQVGVGLFSYAATVIERCRLFSAVACCSAKNGENSPGLVSESERGGCGRQLMRGGNRIS